jgi:8-oxo-dGTP pyrophosphatase MutT (NUDIX family)
MYKKEIICNKCGKNGHIFSNCVNPITSLGIIAFKYSNPCKYLMVRRKDSYGFVFFISGSYNIYDKPLLDNISSVLTNNEKKRLLTEDFNTLWCSIWGSSGGANNRSAENDARVKLEQLKKGVSAKGVYYDLDSIIRESKGNWDVPEWGFPKGRRDYQENDLSCAMREFEEETGYDKNKLILINNVMPFSEICIGSNYKLYKHSYYIANMKHDVEYNTDDDDECRRFETNETSEVKWFTYDEAIKTIRPYNKEKIEILTRVDTMLKTYTLYS